MDHYVTVGTNDPEVSNAFYDAVLATIDWSSHVAFPGWRAYSRDGTGKGMTLWICKPFDGEPARAGNGAMPGFAATTRGQVDAFYRAAMAHGGQDDGAPGLRPHYGPDWYAAYVRDPSGNKLAIVHNS